MIELKWKYVLGGLVGLWILTIPFSIDGYTLALRFNVFLGQFCDLTKPIVDTRNIEWAKNLRGNYSVIREEFYAFERQHAPIPRISDVSSGQDYLDKIPEYPWRSLFLRVYGWDTEHLKSFPRLQELVANIPDVSTIMFSILDPHYIGDQHVGVYRGIHRYLLGLEVRACAGAGAGAELGLRRACCRD